MFRKQTYLRMFLSSFIEIVQLLQRIRSVELLKTIDAVDIIVKCDTILLKKRYP